MARLSGRTAPTLLPDSWLGCQDALRRRCAGGCQNARNFQYQASGVRRMLWEVCLHAAVALAGIPYVETDAAAASSTRYKYIVVGGGAAGCAAAATLAERHPTLLVERGPVRTVAPTTDSFDTFHARFGLDDWAQIGDMITTTEGTRAISPRVLGGATAFNAGIYNRDEVNGSFERAGFDPSRIASAYEWIESIVEPQLAKAEADGSLVAALRAEAGSRLGLPFDGSAPIEMPSRPGLFRTYTTLPQGGRGRTAADDLLKRPGLRLTVLVQSPVALVLLDEQSRAVGIEFRDERDGRRYRAFVEDEGGEVVVSSGVFGTPPLLMRSGIGPAGHLAEHGIPVRVDSPTVGEITEPPTHMFGVFGNSDQPQPGVINSFAGRLNAHIVMESFSHEVQTRGLIAAQCSLIPAPRRTEADCKRLASIMAERSDLNRDFVSFVGFGIKLLDPASRGTVRLRSRSADDLPLVTLNQYLEQADLQKMVAAVKQVAEVVSSPSISAVRASRTPTMLTFLQGTLQGTDGTLEPPPFINVPPEGANETAIASLLKDSVATFYHTCGGTVGAVSRDFTVNGAIGLRVADLSILHHAPGTNPMASAMVIGRYAAQVIADRPMRTSSAIDTAAFSSRDNGPSVTIGAGAIVGVALGAAAAVVVAAALGILALRNCRNAPEAGLAIAASLDRLARANSEIDEMSRSIAEGWPNPDSAEAALAEGRQILPRKRLLLRCVAAFMPVSIRPCSVLLKDVSAFCCDIKNRSKVNAVLSNVCCSFGAGRVSAIVGPSGSGKSTLMDYLARARSHAHFSGSIRFGGVGFEEWRKENRVGFVPQQSTFVPVLSAYEHLLFQAALRMPGADHATRVLKVNKVPVHPLTSPTQAPSPHQPTPLHEGDAAGRAPRKEAHQMRRPASRRVHGQRALWGRAAAAEHRHSAPRGEPGAHSRRAGQRLGLAPRACHDGVSSRPVGHGPYRHPLGAPAVQGGVLAAALPLLTSPRYP